MNLFRRYAELSKVEDQDDGTIKVWGYCSSGAEDTDGETVLPEAMKAALPDYMKFGAVREMHQAIAAGTAIEAKVEEDGRTFFGAHIVDPIAIKKVKAGVYKGFSIGGKVLERDPANKKTITKLKLIENSLVDRPANPDAVFTFYKLDSDEKPPAVEPAAPAKVDPPAVAPTEPVKQAAAPAKEISAEDRAAIEQLGVIVNKGEMSAKDLLAAGLAAIAKAKAGPRKKILVAETKKGMGALSQFAQLLQSIGWLAQDCAGEAAWEGDDSVVPMQLRDWLATGVMIFETMSTEETSEMLAGLKPALEVVTAAAKAQILAGLEAEHVIKAGSKFSSATQKALADCHSAMLACADVAKSACDGMAKLGYQDDHDDAKAELPSDVLKAAITPPVQTPATSPDEQLTKALAAFESASKTIDDLQKRLKLLEDQPAPAKGPTRVVGKTEDTDNPATATAPVLNDDGTVNKAATDVKAIHQAGPMPLGSRAISQWNRPRH